MNTDSNTPSPLAELRKLVIAQKTVHLPEEAPRSEPFRSLHQAVTAYDQFVSQMVIATLQGGTKSAEYPDAANLQQKVQTILEDLSLDQRTVQLYVVYYRRLVTLNQFAQAAIAENAAKI